jgi:RimJ/RimL family protein N-acetyltransferase
VRTIKTFGTDLFGQGEILEALYKIIFENMTEILGEYPAAADESGKQCWLEFNRKAAIEGGRKTAVAFDGGIPCGFFQYAKCGRDICRWDEIQIAKAYQSDGQTFWALVRTFLQDADFLSCKNIYAYINRLNHKSQAVARHIGFVKYAETERGAQYVLERPLLEKRLEKSV